MFPFPAIINPLVAILSISTAAGVFVHDTNIDKAALTAVSSVMTHAEDGSAKVIQPGSHLHTHAERISLSQAVNDLKNQVPRVQARNGDDRKYTVSKKPNNTSHGGGSYSWPSV